jgi:hypothetical protein
MRVNEPGDDMLDGTADRRESDHPNEDERASQWSTEAENQAEDGKTIEDILRSITEAFDPEQDEAVRQIARLLSDGEFSNTVERMQQLPEVISGRRWSEASLQAADLADRMDLAAQQLDMLHRQIVAPRVEQLRALERRAVQLREALEQLDTEDTITRWHRRAEALIDDLRQTKVAEEPAQKLAEEMATAGWGDPNRDHWEWTMSPGGAYTAPSGYAGATRALIEEIQRLIQELMVGDLLADQDQPVPPQYESLVDRYREVLSADVRQPE